MLPLAKMTEDGKKEITNKPETANDQATSAASAVVQDEKPAVKVEKDELWIKVQYRSNLIITDKDGKVVFSRIVPAGSEQRLRGARLTMFGSVLQPARKPITAAHLSNL